ncbi:MAG: permease [Hyphomicrobiales bacterium]
MSLAPASLPWFARHELSLFWRDWLSMMTAGKRGRGRVLALVLAALAAGLHWIALSVLGPWLQAGAMPTKAVLVMMSGCAVLAFSLMLSQGMETVTRAYYARSDLDLILSSPASSRRLFAVRTLAAAFTVIAMPCLLASPFINTLVIMDGANWLAAYGVLASLGLVAAALGIIITTTLFSLAGAKRTRLISQILAAVIGAAFIIGIQAAAVVYYGNLSRLSVLQSPELIAWFPAADSIVWLPARAAMGDWPALLFVMSTSICIFAAVVITSSRSFGQLAVAAAGVSETRKTSRRRAKCFRTASARTVLRRKEWMLLARDPWLVSQSAMQILYLLPPALLLWSQYRESVNVLAVAVPVLVMAAGQLAGGLAWLAVSGEDAPDLVDTAPLGKRAVLIAKVEAVISLIFIIVSPMLIGLALISVEVSIIAALGIMLAASSATAIQLWFKVQAKRAMFRRRQVSSRTATFSEAAVSILWAATAGLFVAGSGLGIIAAFVTIGALGFVWLIRPTEEKNA